MTLPELLVMCVPILIWEGHKNTPGINVHGRAVVNWMISYHLYIVLVAPLGILLSEMGVPRLVLMLPATMGIVMLITFPIIGGIKARQGTLWKYPLAISFCE